MPALVSAFVLAGMSFQGIQQLKAAEMDYVIDDKAEGTEGTEGTDKPNEPNKADKTALEAAIKQAETGKNQADYSTASWEKYKTALDAAKEINGKEDATQDQVDEAVKNLEAAAGGLEKVPGQPGSVKATWKGKKTVSITWKKASDATKYQVYRSYKKTSGFKKIAEVTKTSYTDKKVTAGKTAYYKVMAYNGNVQGTFSKAANAYIVKTPASVKAKASKTTVTVSFKKSAKASGYEIWRSTKKTSAYKKAATLKSGKSVKKQFKNVKGGTYYYKVRAYKKSGSKKVYTDYGKPVKVKVSPGSTIENTKSQVAIEADIKLTGTGTGYHAKLVMNTATAAVSFGMQYDAHAVAPYTGKTMLLIENVSSNAAGQQKYSRPGDISLQLNKTYHLMMTLDTQGNGDVYLDYKKVGSFYQPNLTGYVYLRIEAAARLNGDSVNATFSNIKCKWNGKYDSNNELGKSLSWGNTFALFTHNAGMRYKYNKGKNIQIYGTLQGVNGDWDSDYENVQGILQFQGPY